MLSWLKILFATLSKKLVRIYYLLLFEKKLEFSIKSEKVFRHKKKWGQNFLKDKNICQKIVTQANIAPDDIVWEIGPGKGALTLELLKTGCRLHAFEIDKTLYPHLQKIQEDYPEFTLVKQDILKADWEQYLPKNQKIIVVANLPYQITSPFLFKMANFTDNLKHAVVMIQKEVAERIKANKKSKNYGILSVKMQYDFCCKLLFNVSPHLFYPPPKVVSSVISLIPRLDKPEIENKELFWKTIDLLFRPRRKMLRNNLKTLLKPDQISSLDPKYDLKRRGESFAEDEIISLYRDIFSIL